MTDDFEIVYHEVRTGDISDASHLICKHCGARVERGIINVATHWHACEKLGDKERTRRIAAGVMEAYDQMTKSQQDKLLVDLFNL